MTHSTLILSVLCCLSTLSAAGKEPAPPPHTDLVGNARWIVKHSNVSVVATQSSFLPGYPFAQSKDVADGVYGSKQGTGIPYIYSSPLAQLVHDFIANPKVTFAYSAEFTHYCKDEGIDNDSPTCGKVMLTGDMVKVTDSVEHAWAWLGMVRRHPAIIFYPPGHNFAFFKLDIKNIFALDYFGGPTKHLNVTEYLNYTPTW